MATPPKDKDAASKPMLRQRQSSTLHYQTFPTAPPKNAGRPPPTRKDLRGSPSAHGNGNGAAASSDNSGDADSRASSSSGETPLPKGQLAILAVIALAEQTALNSISPYLPDMASSFPDVSEDKIGLYVGLIASSFALAQFATNFLWGWLSDRVGRKPIVLTGTFLTAICFVGFGFCRTFWQAVLAQALMGVVNGNQGVISTCLGEITDRTNQSRAFTYLPVIYGIGGITGPLVGGLLVMKDQTYPYLYPNLFAAGVLIIDLVLTMIFLEESLDNDAELPPLKKRIGSLFSWIWQFSSSSHNPSYLRNKLSSKTHRPLPQEDSDDEDDEDSASEASHQQETLEYSAVFNRDTILLLSSYLIFQLGNISYNSLYPIFSEAQPPTGRSLSTTEIGTSLAFAGLITIVFQVGVFGKLRERMGNKSTYRVGLLGFVIAFCLMPWVGYKDGKDGTGPETQAGKIWLWIELGVVLIVKTVASVGGLTSALLLITNSAPSHAVLGTLNGLAQTLSAAGRAVGPFISGALFSAATKVHPKGEALAFGVFGGISFLGFLMSFGIRGRSLEAEGWEEDDGEDDEDSDEEAATGQ